MLDCMATRSIKTNRAFIILLQMFFTSAKLQESGTEEVKHLLTDPSSVASHSSFRVLQPDSKMKQRVNDRSPG